MVQTYTGQAIVGRYPDDRFPNLSNAVDVWPSVEFENGYKRFLAKHAVATAARFRQLYARTGMASVWRFIIGLRQLAGETVTPVDRANTGSAWSLREVNRLVKQNLGTYVKGERVSVAQLLVPLDVGTLVVNLVQPAIQPARPASLRKMLEIDAA